mgnify:CR=1 FL=1
MAKSRVLFRKGFEMKLLLLSCEAIAFFKTLLTTMFSPLLEFYTSNLLIMHEDKRNEITTVRRVWVCGPNRISLTIKLMLWEAYQTLERVFHQISLWTLQSWLKKNRLSFVFSTQFSVFGYLMKHSPLDILLEIKPRWTSIKRFADGEDILLEEKRMTKIISPCFPRQYPHAWPGL